MPLFDASILAYNGAVSQSLIPWRSFGCALAGRIHRKMKLFTRFAGH